jgi:hypothetical protein
MSTNSRLKKGSDFSKGYHIDQENHNRLLPQIPNTVLRYSIGRAMAQAVSRRPLTDEARASPCGICGDKVAL